VSTDDEERLTLLAAGQRSKSVQLPIIATPTITQWPGRICAQAPSRPEGRARARSERSGESCTVPSTDRVSKCVMVGSRNGVQIVGRSCTLKRRTIAGDARLVFGCVIARGTSAVR
jgi:hypothetical protein